MKNPAHRTQAHRTLIRPLAALLLVLGCARSGVDELVGSRPPIIVVSIDTLRSDHLPVYGYDGVETPAIDALRRDGVLFERAYSPMPLTLPAHASMLSGLLPPEHGVRDNMGYRLDGARMPLVAERLSAAGYETGAAVSSFVLRGDTGIAQGFDFFDDGIELTAGVGAEGLQRDGRDTLEAVLPWLRSVSGQPFFLFLHLYEPHTPYRPKEPFASRYVSPYDGEIATVDGIVGALVEELRSLGDYDEAFIVLTSDHGEGLGDHGEEEHGIFVYRESLQVPLIVKLPGQEMAGATVSSPAQIIDIPPTLLAMAGDRDAPEMTGVSLLELLGGEGPDRELYAESYYPRLYFGWSEQVSLLDDRYQFIDGPAPELFDLGADPGQRENLAESLPNEVARYRQLLSRIDTSFDTPQVVDLETRRRLESLGYVGGTHSAQEGPRPDPRSQAHLLDLLGRATREADAGRLPEAVALFDQLLVENPGMALAWEQKGRALRRLGRVPEAIEAYGRALELSRGAPHLTLTLARLKAARSRFDEARELASAAVDWDPVGAHILLARLDMATNRLDEALAHAEAAVAAGEASADTLVVLAQVRLARGESEEALAVTDRALAVMGDEPVQALNLVRGNALTILERYDEAERNLRTEIERFPADARAYVRLSVLLTGTGRAGEVRPLLEALVRRNPSPPAYAAAIQTLASVGDMESAEAMYSKAMETLPDPALLARLLGQGAGTG